MAVGAELEGDGRGRVATIEMEGLGRTSAPDGQRLVLAVMDAGVDILHRCGGMRAARRAVCRSWVAIRGR
jgi:hypothetical protein